MTHVLTVSMPRSGHHLFETILHNTLAPKMRYCEFYGKTCCKAIPCERQTPGSLNHDGRLFLQKSHDWDFSDPMQIACTYRVVQYRSPVPRVLSAYETHVAAGGSDNEQSFRKYLENDAVYFCNFYHKWIEPRDCTFFYLTYEELTSDPMKALIAFFHFIEMPMDGGPMSEGIKRSMGWRARSDARFARADVYAHRYASLPALWNFEDIVIRNCPGYSPARYFSVVGNSDDSLIGYAFNTRMALYQRDKEGSSHPDTEGAVPG